ncbi:MAG: hypothetical protein V1811_00875 [Candidatus Micrarchaeota archaeon]
MKKPVGKISHYFGHLGVAVLELSDALRNGEKIEVVNAEGQTVLTQIVSSMQIDCKQVAEAKPGQTIGLKVATKLHPGNAVLKVIA